MKSGLKSLMTFGVMSCLPALLSAADFTISVPEGADLQVGTKTKHFVDFTLQTPVSVVTENRIKTYTFDLAPGSVYNYRASMSGGLTHAGYFTMNADASKCPVIKLTEEDFGKKDPKAFNHDPQSNSGYETGDIFVNINPEGFLEMKSGESFDVHAMRTWELTDNAVNNYFIEPDFHYTVLDLEGKVSSEVITVEQTPGSAWANLRAMSKGTAIVLVSYDGINLNYYSGTEKKDYLGGEYWGAVWPENTAVYVVSVDGNESTAKPNMIVNDKYNEDAKKLAGKFVDAEHDVFYYLDDAEGYEFSFSPENVCKVEIAYPEISANGVAYKGFGEEGVSKDAEGVYTVMLKKGRQIIRLTDESGNSVYRVLTAKPCHREIQNVTRQGSKVFQPGDKIKIQYSGLYHPANKIAGIYNMSAYVTYNGKPNGSSLIQGSGQYTFGSAAEAQAVTVDIPVDIDLSESSQIVLNEGVIQVNGFGDPIGNHRLTDKNVGRAPNFNAVAHKTYFGAIPAVTIDLSPYKTFRISLLDVPEGAETQLTFNGNTLTPDAEGFYSGTYGTYSLTATADGYRRYMTEYKIGDEADESVEFHVAMEMLDGAWDGKTMEQPSLDDDGRYLIATPAEMAWFAKNVNDKGVIQDAILVNDLHLGNFDWTPIGTSSSSFTGNFDGQGHKIEGLYISTKTNNQGFFGYIKDASVKGLEVYGTVSGKQYVGGIAGYAAGKSSIDRCANYATVSATGTYVGGVVANLYAATGSVTNSYNAGNVSGTSNCGGVVGYNNKDAVIENIFNVGDVKGTTVGACVGGNTAKNNVNNAFALRAYQITAGQETVTRQQMESGEIAYALGEAFSQTLGQDMHPVFGALKVYYDSDKDVYYNITDADRLTIELKDVTIDLNDEPTLVLTAVHGPEYSLEPKVEWSSSDESIATVDHDGTLTARITGLKSGSVKIKVEKADNPEVYDTCNVLVTESVSVAEIFDDNSEGPVNVYDLGGHCLLRNATESQLRDLDPGLYIIRKGKEGRKVVVK